MSELFSESAAIACSTHAHVTTPSHSAGGEVRRVSSPRVPTSRSACHASSEARYDKLRVSPSESAHEGMRGNLESSGDAQHIGRAQHGAKRPNCHRARERRGIGARSHGGQQHGSRPDEESHEDCSHDALSRRKQIAPNYAERSRLVARGEIDENQREAATTTIDGMMHDGGEAESNQKGDE